MNQKNPSDRSKGSPQDHGSRQRPRKANPRSLHRMRSHEAAEAEAALTPPVVIPDHPLICKDEPQLINTPETLTELLDHVRAVGSFAYDTEFIGEMSYYPRLCLVQIATHQRVALVDPLADINLDELHALIVDPDIEAVVHAGVQDLMPVARLTNRTPENIFDTQIAAGLAGLSYPLGLGRLIEELIDLRLGKGLTFSHWDHRPLTELQLRYAADDVRYLPALKAELLNRLDTLGHRESALRECVSVAAACGEVSDPETLFRRIKGVHTLRPRRMAVLRELAKLREQAARDHDVPPRSLIKDAVLLDLARTPVKSVEKLAKIPGLPRRFAQGYGEAIIASTTAALELPKEQLPRLPDFIRETPGDQVRIESLNNLAANLCQAKMIASGLTLNRKDIVQLYFAIMRNNGVDDCRLMQNWRREMLGEPLREFIEGRRTFTLAWRDGRLREADPDGS